MKTERKSNSPIYNMGFKQTSGKVSDLMKLAQELVKTPNTPLNRRFNALVNSFVAEGNIYGLQCLKALQK